MNRLTLRDIVNAVPKSHEINGLLDLLQQTKEAQRHLPLPTLIAVYLVHDLYHSGSSDSANVRRITTNIENTADTLLSISKLIQGLV